MNVLPQTDVLLGECDLEGNCAGEGGDGAEPEPGGSIVRGLNEPTKLGGGEDFDEPHTVSGSNVEVEEDEREDRSEEDGEADAGDDVGLSHDVPPLGLVVLADMTSLHTYKEGVNWEDGFS